MDRDLTDPDGAEALLRTAEDSFRASMVLGTPNLDLPGTGSRWCGTAGAPGERGTGEIAYPAVAAALRAPAGPRAS